MPDLKLTGQYENPHKLELLDVILDGIRVTSHVILPNGERVEYNMLRKTGTLPTDDEYNVTLSTWPTGKDWTVAVEAHGDKGGKPIMTLPMGLVPYVNKMLTINENLAAPLRKVITDCPGALVDGKWTGYDGWHEVLLCDVPDSIGDAIMVSLGGYTRAEDERLSLLASGPIKNWQVYKDWLDNGREGEMP